MSANLHACPLFAERHKQILRQPPVKKRTIAACAHNFKHSHFSDLGYRALGSGHRAVLRIIVDKHLYLVAGA